MVFLFSFNEVLGLIRWDFGGVHHRLSLGIECRYALAKNHFLNVQYYVRDPATLSTHRLQDFRLKNLDEMGAFLRCGTRHNKYRLAIIILARHQPHLMRTIIFEPHLQLTNQST